MATEIEQGCEVETFRKPSLLPTQVRLSKAVETKPNMAETHGGSRRQPNVLLANLSANTAHGHGRIKLPVQLPKAGFSLVRTETSWQALRGRD
jgi:hypothetical protein